jgi:hypothetical protein
MAEKEGGSSVAAISLQPDTSADQLNVAETTTRTTTTLPAIPSPEQKREKNMKQKRLDYSKWSGKLISRCMMSTDRYCIIL